MCVLQYTFEYGESMSVESELHEQSWQLSTHTRPPRSSVKIVPCITRVSWGIYKFIKVYKYI